MTKRFHLSAAKLVLALLVAGTLAGCETTVGVGVAVAAPGGFSGPWGGGYVGAPIWP